MASLLYQAASDGYVDSRKVAEILGGTKDDAVPAPAQLVHSQPSVRRLPQLSGEFSKALRRNISQDSNNTGTSCCCQNNTTILFTVAVCLKFQLEMSVLSFERKHYHNFWGKRGM